MGTFKPSDLVRRVLEHVCQAVLPLPKSLPVNGEGLERGSLSSRLPFLRVRGKGPGDRGKCFPYTLSGSRPGTETDQRLDDWLRAALLEEARIRPPATAWERLRQAVVERRRRKYGMWVLDEPQREPPESPPMLLSRQQYRQARRLYGERGRVGGMSDLPFYRDTVWGGMMPVFYAVFS